MYSRWRGRHVQRDRSIWIFYWRLSSVHRRPSSLPAALSQSPDRGDDVLIHISKVLYHFLSVLRRFGASPLRARSTPSPTSTPASRSSGTSGQESCRSRWDQPITSSPAAPTEPWRWGSSPTASALPIATTRKKSRTMSNSTYENQELVTNWKLNPVKSHEGFFLSHDRRWRVRSESG